MSTHHRPRWTSVCLIAVAALFGHVPSALAIDTFEPNDTLPTATPIVFGSSRVSYLATTTDVDYYRFTVSSPQHLRIDLAVPDTMACSLGLYASNGNFIDAISGRGVGVDETMVTTLAEGEYYIRISGSTADDVNSYTLSLTGPLSGDDFEPNDRAENATALPLGTTISSFIFTRQDEDWYRIVTTADAHLAVTLNVPESVNYDLSLWDNLGFFVGGSGQSGKGQDEEVVTTVPAGTYFAKVVTCCRDYTQGQRYSLTAISGTFTDSFEPNNTRASARRLGPGTVLSKMYSNRDEDWYRFNLSATGTVSILLEVPPSLALRFDLLNGSGNVVASVGPLLFGADASLVRTLTGPGAYYIRVFTGFSGSLEDYTLRLGGGTITTPSMVPGDFDANGVTDLAVYRSATGTWYVSGQFVVQFGPPAAIPVPGDYNGDGTADIAVYQPASGNWFVRNQFAVQFGEPSDVPVPGDYNGDGVTDIAVYRPSTGFWYVRNLFAIQFGERGDLPVPADYNGDGAVDIAVYRRATGSWFVRNQFVVGLGQRGDLPVPGDYDGDGSADVAVYRPSTGLWLVRNQPSQQLGGPGFRPVPGDYNNDGITDVAVYELASGVWSVLNQFAAQFGGAGDVPVTWRLMTLNRAASDFDGNGTTDVGVYRPSTGQWFVRNQPTVQFGDAGDRPVPADYNGDGVVDIAVYRPSTSMWSVRSQFEVLFGNPSDIPVPGDYNGDGRADIAVYRPSTGTWYVRNLLAVQFGDAGDIPVPGDYNGDGITDFAVYRPSTGTWYVRNLLAAQFGDPGDVPVPGDYDGDGTTDLAVFRPSSAMWFVRNQLAVSFGTADDTLVPGDYDGDGATDIAVYQPSTGTWLIRRQFTVQHGDAGDEPLVRRPGAF